MQDTGQYTGLSSTLQDVLCCRPVHYRRGVTPKQPHGFQEQLHREDKGQGMRLKIGLVSASEIQGARGLSADRKGRGWPGWRSRCRRSQVEEDGTSVTSVTTRGRIPPVLGPPVTAPEPQLF